MYYFRSVIIVVVVLIIEAVSFLVSSVRTTAEGARLSWREGWVLPFVRDDRGILLPRTPLVVVVVIVVVVVVDLRVF